MHPFAKEKKVYIINWKLGGSEHEMT